MTTESNLTLISQDVYAARDVFVTSLVDKSLNFDAEAGFALQQLGKNDYMQKAALNNRQAVYDAVVNIAAIGISLNPAKKQAYLVPRDNRICLDISYMGLMDLAQATGSVKWAQAALVYATDTFTLNGLDKPPTHVFNPFSTERGDVVGVYCTVKTADGDYLTHTMTYADALAIRDRSAAWKMKQSGPWKTDEAEMVKKSCVKQAYKYWPKTDRLENAIHHLNENNGEGLAIIEEEKKQPEVKKISGRDALKEEYESLTADRKQIVDAVVSNVVDLFNSDDVIGAYEEYNGLTVNAERAGAWYFLPSNIRSAITKHGNELKGK